ncbi:MAG TPA: PfkB family carbohydrate kinase [Planctomycetota bacterium]
MLKKTVLCLGERAGLADRVNATGGRAVASLEDPAEAAAVVYGAGDWGAPLERLLAAAKKAVRFCDLDLKRGTRETVPACVQSAHVLRINAAEAREMAATYGIPAASGRRFLEALGKGAKLDTVVVTLGAKGAAARQGERVVVSFGYGKGASEAAFGAGFLRARLEGWDLDACCRWGNGFAALGDGPLPEDWSDRLGAMLPDAGWSDDLAYWIS